MMMSEEIHASFWDHVEELRSIFIRTLAVILLGLGLAFYYHENLTDLLVASLPETELFLFSPIEGFIALFRLSFWTGVLGTSPYWISGVVRFLKPALRGKEKEWLPLFFILSFVFIASGLVFCLKVTLPIAAEYLFTFNRSIGINLWGFSAYLDFALMLLFSHGAAFEIGALLFFLIHARIIDGAMLKKKRRHAIVASLIIGALLTPPDVLTQIAVALPLILFYELAILYSYLTRT